VQHLPLNVALADAVEAEHICLESDEIVVERRIGTKRIGPCITITNRLRGCATELAVLDGHRLEVRTRHPRGADQRYVVDLRFVDAAPLIRRHVGWRLWQACLLLGMLALLTAWLATPTRALLATPWLLPLALASTSIGAAALAVYRTYETVAFLSIHGRTVLVEATGGLRCRRACGEFVAALERRVTEARRTAAQPKQQFLRDELREHRRLFEDGVLSEARYETGKRSILRAHA
jgi:hypothetical protein